MPVPKPEPEEKEAAYLERCVLDEAMVADHPEEEQRATACKAAWDKAQGESEKTPVQRADDDPPTVPLPEVPELETVLKEAVKLQEEFMTQCMADATLKTGYPDEAARTEVCRLMWEGKTAETEEAPVEEPEKKPVQRSAIGTLLLIRRQEGMQAPQVLADTGEITGYVLTWEYSGDGIQFTKGCFTKSLKERAGKIPLLVTHMKEGSSVFETVGFVQSGVEDDKGLLVTADFLETQLAQAIREQALAGGIKGMSIQAKPIRYEVLNNLIVAYEASFVEATLTNNPLDKGAEVLAVREDPSAATRAAAATAALAEAREDAVRREATLALLSLGEAD